jgi:hypothetical protein
MLVLIAGLSTSLLFYPKVVKRVPVVPVVVKPLVLGAAHCDSLFNDLPWAHKSAYDSVSIGPFSTGKELYKSFLAGALTEIGSNFYYELDTLTHSYPYLLPDAKSFLHELGVAYQQACTEKEIPFQRYIVTSATRTISSVRRLRRINRNSIRFSPHLKGKTIDIASDRFEKPQLSAFIATLNELRMQGRCFVKYERIQGCFHITVR